MGDILVDTASSADKSVLDSRLFYPKEANTAEARLRYYATRFPLVEVDSSTTPCLHRRWRNCGRSALESFVFDVTEFRIFTQHQAPLGPCQGNRGGARATGREEERLLRLLPVRAYHGVVYREIACLDPGRGGLITGNTTVLSAYKM